MRKANWLALWVASFLVSAASAAAEPPLSAKSVLGHEMATYTAQDNSFSLLYPKGWTVVTAQNGVSIAQSTKDATSARIDLYIYPSEGRITSQRVVEMLEEKMKEQYPSFSEDDNLILSNKPDVYAVMFSYREGEVLMSGVGIAASLGNAVLWADIYGRDSGFADYNAAALLTYVMQSMNQGGAPTTPPLPKVTKKTESAASARSRKVKRAAVMTHYWNMLPHLYPTGL